MTQVADKPSLDEVMEHYGVLGMHWGTTRAKAGGVEIRKARRNLQGYSNKYEDQREIMKKTGRKSVERIDAKKKLSEIKTSYLKDPDRVTANRLTRGEKVAIVVLSGPIGLLSVAGTSAASRRIEYKQLNNKY